MSTLVYCGAHVGGTLASLVGKFDRIEAFEPNPRLAGELRRRFGGARHVRIHELALAEKPGTLRFRVYGDSGASSSLAVINPQAVAVVARRWPEHYFDCKAEYDVQAVNLAEWLRGSGIDEVAMLVTDLQGFDVAVLDTVSQWLARGAIRRVQCEVDANELPHYLGAPDNSLARAQALFRQWPEWRQCEGPTAAWPVDADHLQADVVFERCS